MLGNMAVGRVREETALNGTNMSLTPPYIEKFDKEFPLNQYDHWGKYDRKEIKSFLTSTLQEMVDEIEKNAESLSHEHWKSMNERQKLIPLSDFKTFLTTLKTRYGLK